MITEKCSCGARVTVEYPLPAYEHEAVAAWRTGHRHTEAAPPRESQVDAYVETAVPHQPHAPLGFGLPPRPTTDLPEGRR